MSIESGGPSEEDIGFTMKKPESSDAPAEAWLALRRIQDEMETNPEADLDELTDWLENSLNEANYNNWSDLAEAIRQELKTIKQRLAAINTPEIPTPETKSQPEMAEVIRKALWGKQLASLGLKSAFKGWTKLGSQQARAIWGHTEHLTIEVSFRLDQLDQTTIVAAQGKRSFQKGGLVIIELTVTDQGQLIIDQPIDFALLEQNPEAMTAVATLLKPVGLDSQFQQLLESAPNNP